MIYHRLFPLAGWGFQYPAVQYQIIGGVYVLEINSTTMQNEVLLFKDFILSYSSYFSFAL